MAFSASPPQGLGAAAPNQSVTPKGIVLSN